MVPQLLMSRSSLLASHPMVGCSTGYMADSRGVWPSLVSEAALTSPAAVELSALSARELPALLEYLNAAPRLPFHFISVHGPSKGMQHSDDELVDRLIELPVWISVVVLHPDVMAEVAPYRRLGRRLAIENMDTRKTVGQTADQLAGFFDELPDARLCFDVAHASDVDATLEVGSRILGRFADRLSHVHVSSLDEDQHHVPLTAADEERFGSTLRRCADVPWILEAPPR